MSPAAAKPGPGGIAETSRSPRSGVAMVFMRELGEAVMFGGADEHGDAFGDTWIWRNECWRPAHASTGPSPRSGAAMAYDPTRRQAILFGSSPPPGYENLALNDTWAWDGVKWMRLADGPAHQINLAGAFDESTRRVLMVTTDATDKNPATWTSKTWTWDGAGWLLMHPSMSLPWRAHASLAADPATHRVLLFGGYGYNGRPSAETWEWDGRDWTLLTPPTSPPGMDWAAMSGFAAKGQLVLTGIGQTWTWDGRTWSESAASPGNRSAATMVDTGQLVLLYGGNAFRDQPETLTWDGEHWQVPAQPAGT
jgi:hypothetical protein